MNAVEGLEGKRLGKLTVLGRAKSARGGFWRCACDCGKEVVFAGMQINSGRLKSCGCINRPDLSGLKFSRLSVIGLAQSSRTQRKWLCQCECGSFVNVGTSKLLNGHTKSCGCVRLGTVLPSRRKESPALNSLVSRYIYAAKTRGLCFELSVEKAASLFQAPCFYCGAAPSRLHRKRYISVPFAYNGIDRLDNKAGYTDSNVVSSCFRCNQKKRDMNFEDFKQWIKKTHEHISKRKAWGRPAAPT